MKSLRWVTLLVASLSFISGATAQSALGEDEDAYRFLVQAAFGPREGDVAALLARADEPLQAYAEWIDEQMEIEPSLLLPAVQQAYASGKVGPNVLNDFRQQIWMRNVMTSRDQLRQRVAFALSELLVVSQNSSLDVMMFSTADYYDMLARNAFGDYRVLLEKVTLHPAMGVYLNMLGNRKPDPANNIRPDENYARELMQLFSIGLVQLNPDGSIIRSNQDGVPIPTYDQSVVEGFAHAFTGWNYTGFTSFALAKRTNANQVLPMRAYPDQHANGEKRLLSYQDARYSVLPAGQLPEKDLSDALDNVFEHPNVAPFVARHLIQRLVTSNPTPEYIQRVAAVFDNDGTGQRGQLGAVVKAILLDPEARGGPSDDVSGKTKEPLLRLIQFWRAYDAKARNGNYSLGNPIQTFGQGQLASPSVFNFFSPFYAPPGEIADRELVSPEIEIATEYFNTLVTNYFYGQIFKRNSRISNLSAASIVIDIEDEVALAGSSEAMVDLVARKLLGGVMSPALRAAALKAAGASPTQAVNRVTDAIYLIATSPEFAVQR